ncbi:unnamed protein product [Commensalibacter communis]|uniref:hypothetical protein n=1 Tax=Commensalibacter communis TaxID=2972786 RepID=UPI0022FF52F9|nr:hypothetical protein [Commensalibacter communis]CAI3955311.1 unnamed protein product [Commensalibacter communis]CAI3956060.1 unnamed protein product [Commensalibacter communis]
MKNQKQINGQVVAYGTEDVDFPELETIDQEELYNLIAKFIRKAIPIKGEKLSIVNGLSNRVSPPQTPYI